MRLLNRTRYALLLAALGCACESPPAQSPAAEPAAAESESSSASAGQGQVADPGSDSAAGEGQALQLAQGDPAPDAGADPRLVVPEADPDKPRVVSEEEALAIAERLAASPRHRPPRLDGPPAPTRVALGSYRCRVGKGYKLRKCRVYKNPAGHTLLEIGSGNLVGATGVLWDEGKTVRFTGWHTDATPFGCTGCQARCRAVPNPCGCPPLPAVAVVECLRQPLEITFTGQSALNGKLELDSYSNVYTGQGAERRVTGHEHERQQLPVQLFPGK